MIRNATLNDLDALVSIENRCFDSDRISRRSFRHLLTKAHAVVLVEEENGQIRADAVVLFNMGTSLARLYSFAVDPDFRNQGIGKALLAAAEDAARENDCVTMRLEVRRDNDKALSLWRQAGYKQFGLYHDYYEDHMEALRFEKALVSHLNADMVRVPYYQQTLDFTCGPSSLMMAMKSIDPELQLDRMLELRVWRESTTVFMTAGHGGCGPYGMALSAFHRGFDVEVYVNIDPAEGSTLFVDSVRSDEKKEVMRLVEQDFLQELSELPIAVHYGSLTLDEVQEKFEEGGIPIVLISSYRIYREKFPHWVVVTGFDERYIYVHDPYVDEESGKTITDCVNMPILKKDFERMARYGKAGQKAALILKNRSA